MPVSTKKLAASKQKTPIPSAASKDTITPPPAFTIPNLPYCNSRNYNILSLAVLILMILASLMFGINGDEIFQVDYSKKLWNYYTSFGADHAALNVPAGNMHLYGGLFDLLAIAFNKLMGLDDEFVPEYHYIRRVLCAVFGMMVIYFTGLFGKQIGGWPLAFLTFFLLLLSPRFMGDSMVNPKDIPFAAGFIMGLYFISKYIRELPKPTTSTMAGIIGGSLIALNTRAGGLLLIVYLFLFVGVYILKKYDWRKLSSHQEVRSAVKYTLLVGLLSYFSGIIFWPYALSDPFINPLRALSEFTKQPIVLSVLFKGHHVQSSNLPWNYIPEWIIRTIPLFSIFGFMFFLRYFVVRMKELPFLEIFMLLFSFFFPICYAIYQHSTLHDGWRHFTFVYPALVLIAACGWVLLYTHFRSKTIRSVIAIGLIIMLTENLYAIFQLHPYQYAYFNPLFGGLKKAYGSFETDYWMLSIKEAAAWLKEHEKTHESKDSVLMVTNCIYPASIYLKDTSANIEVTYSRFYERSEKDWDYALFYSRFIDRSQLLNGSWPPKGTIHTIDRNGIPLCAIVKRENKDDYLGFEAAKRNDIQAAIVHFNRALAYDPRNETASMALSLIYLNIGEMAYAEQTIQQSLKSFPGNPMALKILEDIKLKQKATTPSRPPSN